MDSVNNRIKVKFQLQREPTDSEVKSWLRKTDDYNLQYQDREFAAEKAAKEILPGYREAVYKAEADTIDALLGAAREKVDQGKR